MFAAVALANRGPDAVGVDVWIGATPGGGGAVTYVGPRSGQVVIPGDGRATVMVGPLVGEVTGAPVPAVLLAWRDAGGGEVWAQEGTAGRNRAGATGMVALGAPRS